MICEFYLSKPVIKKKRIWQSQGIISSWKEMNQYLKNRKSPVFQSMTLVGILKIDTGSSRDYIGEGKMKEKPYMLQPIKSNRRGR